jgi:hypothetical protein
MNIGIKRYIWKLNRPYGALPLNPMLNIILYLDVWRSSYSGNIDWNDIVKKEAREINIEDLGEVQEVTEDYVLVEKGVIN